MIVLTLMREKLPPKKLELYQGIDEILWSDWNPIGINKIPSGRDEYSFYVPGIFKMVMDNAKSLDLERYLDDIVHNKMGLRSRKTSNKPIVDKIFELKESLGV